MGLSIAVTKDTMTPDIAAKLAVARKPRKIWHAVGVQVVSLTRRTFQESALRARAWANKKAAVMDENWGDEITIVEGGPSNLKRTGALMRSIRVISSDDSGAVVGTDRKYAAIHQFGGVIRAKAGKRLAFSIAGVGPIFSKSVTIPARPFFPFTPEGELEPMHAERVRAFVVEATNKELKI